MSLPHRWRADVVAFDAYMRLCLDVEYPPEVAAAYDAALATIPLGIRGVKDVRRLVVLLCGAMKAQGSPHRQVVLETAIGDSTRALESGYLGGVAGLLESVYRMPGAA